MSDQAWVEALDLVVGALDGLPLSEVQACCALARGRFGAVEARRLAAEVSADGDTARARRLASAGGKRSKRAARAAAGRAMAVSKNPDLADDLDSGALSDEQLDTIADAIEADESLANDGEFLDGIRSRSVDQGRLFAKQRTSRSRSGESAAARQRRLRRARCFDDRTAGLRSISMAGDDATVDELWRLVRLRERQLREADGGRDLPMRDHPRSLDQRLFDALADLIRGTGSRAGRPSTVFVVPTDGAAHVAGSGPIADQVARDLLARSSVSVQLVDRLSGQPLWQGRLSRRASDAQFLALVVRDRGCVLCGADWVGCEVHHLTPWQAPAKGATDIDNLALLCSDDHHHLHQAHLTLERLDDGVWKTRPATPDESAPSRPTGPARKRPSPAVARARRSRQQQTVAPTTPARSSRSPSAHAGLQPRPGRHATSRPGDPDGDGDGDGDDRGQRNRPADGTLL